MQLWRIHDKFPDRIFTNKLLHVFSLYKLIASGVFKNQEFAYGKIYIKSKSAAVTAVA